jgi:hypothetical protein
MNTRSIALLTAGVLISGMAMGQTKPAAPAASAAAPAAAKAPPNPIPLPNRLG